MQLEIPSRVAQVTHFVLHKRFLLLAFLFMIALSIRLYRANEPPLDFHATRQYRSLLIARAFYYESSSSIPEWKKQVARINHHRQGILEPPVMELLAATGYRLLGGEQYWIPKALSALFWLAGGSFLYRIAKKVFDENAALFSTAFYLFLPFAVTASRSFQPDPLMIMLLLASIYAILSYDDDPVTYRLAIAAVVSAIAIFIKPVSLFVIYSTFLTLTINRQGFQRSIINAGTLIFFLVTLLPTLLFYLYGVFSAGSLKIQAQSSFLPQLLVTPFFWKGWLHNIRLVTGFTLFIGSLFGVLIVPPGRSRTFLLGMWAGYGIFCLTFDYHIATHDYYHLQLIPIVALSLGPLLSFVFYRLFEVNQASSWRLAVWSLASLALILFFIDARPQALDRASETKVKVAEAIGEQVDHATNTVFLSSDYGLSLEYHGELSGLPWPLTSDLEWEQLAGMAVMNAGERFQAWFAQEAPGYFIALDLGEYERQPDLKDFLTENYPVFAHSDDYIIYDLQQ